MLVTAARSILLGLLIFVPAVAYADDDFIWIEGENATSTDIKPHPWYWGAVDKKQLSGGNFLANFSPQEGHAMYRFTAAQAGSYRFWLRVNPIGDPKLDYQLNGGAWTPVDFSHPRDLVNIAADSKPDLRFIAWIDAGPVDLRTGANTISFRFHSANNNHGSIDCFVFAARPFTPSGARKPGQKLGTQETGWWSFEPKPETFGSDALLDLRSLNENEAGEAGFLQAGGDHFELGNGQPVRFWGVDCSLDPAISHDQLDFAARRFAKLGINLVRLHGPLVDRSGNDPTKIDRGKLDNYFYFIEALKKQGIYVDLSTYYVLWFQVKASDGIPGTDDIAGKNPFGLLFFEPTVQKLYKGWLKEILTTRSPYSGKTLAEEPAVGLFEIQNEDSLFFWTFNPEKIGTGPRMWLQQKFGAWLAAKYGSLEKAFAAWPGDHHSEDTAAIGRAGLYGAYEMSSMGFPHQSPDRQKRLLDQIKFLAELQHDFYAGMRHYLRKDLGAKWPVVASNWITAPGLGFVERYTYSGVEVIDKHGYFSGKHEGDGAGWSVRNGQTFTDRSALTDPTAVPFQYVRLPGHPHIQSELAWSKPNRFVGEADLLVSAYESLQGVDGVCFFTTRPDGEWESSGGAMWPFMMPGEIGQSPAEALQYRRYDLEPGETVLRQVTSVDDVLSLKSANLIEGNNTDFHAAESSRAGEAGDAAGFDPLSFFVGRVERTFDAHAQPIAFDLGRYIDRARKVITSSTGQIVWDYGRGIVTVNSPRSQAAAGFLTKAGPIKLGDVTIDCHNEYAAIHVISLDGQPLTTSRKILIQAFTEEKMNGFRTANGVIQEIGRAPIVVRNVDTRVTLASRGAFKATRLDEQGYAAGDLAVQPDGEGTAIVLPPDALYTIVTR